MQVVDSTSGAGVKRPVSGHQKAFFRSLLVYAGGGLILDCGDDASSIYDGSCTGTDGGWGGGGGGGGGGPAKSRTYFLTVASDCYSVPSNGGPVTREITYQLDFMEEGMPKPMFTNQGVISEHLVGLGSVAGSSSPSSGPPGTFPDQQSTAGVGTGHQSGVQTFTATLTSGVTVGLAIAAFGGTVSNPVAALNIQKYPGYISINGDIGGKIDANGNLIPGTYTSCQ
jgi:hypothetical protein